MIWTIAEPSTSGNETPPAIILSNTMTPDATRPAIKPARNPILNSCFFGRGKASIGEPRFWLVIIYLHCHYTYILSEVTYSRGKYTFILLMNCVSIGRAQAPRLSFQ